MEGLEKLSKAATTYARECVTRLRRDPKDPDGLFAQAAILAALGRRAEALASLDFLAQAAPRYPGLWRFKARLYRDVGDPRMEALCRKAADREESA